MTLLSARPLNQVYGNSCNLVLILLTVIVLYNNGIDESNDDDEDGMALQACLKEATKIQ